MIDYHGRVFHHPVEVAQKRYDQLYDTAVKAIEDQRARGNQTLEINVATPDHREFSSDADNRREHTVTITFKYYEERKEADVWTL